MIINCNLYSQVDSLVFREGSIIHLLTVFFAPVAQSELILKDEGLRRTFGQEAVPDGDPVGGV